VEANRPEDLTEVFIDIASDLIKSCEIFLEEQPTGLDDINVALDCETVPRTDPDSGEAQWEIESTSNPPILRLLGETCDTALSDGVRRVDVVFGCPTLT
jgi:hypothetical protein